MLLADAVNWSQALASGGTAAGALALLGLLLRLLFAREEHEYARLETRIVNLEKARDDCLESERALSAELAAVKATLKMLTPGPVAHVSVDDKGNITEWSPGAVALFGWTKEEVSGKPVSWLIPQWLHGQHAASFEKAVKGEGEIQPHGHAVIKNSHAQTKDGRILPVVILLNAWEHEGRTFFSAEIREKT